MATKPYWPKPDGVGLAVRLTPRASRNGLDGVRTEADGRPVLQVRLVAPPVEGAANAALTKFLAAQLGLRQSDITIRSGERSRVKILDLAGDPLSLLPRLDAWVPDPNGPA
ncbi:DUF167 domain-containing protein [Lichenifustis flavocetrariae]|uniref:UPF0235 protein M8523_19950 n=1 Tax=Lichenifustis flavocetrariae TaxID=2949735 RepID=A0AA42CK85_9HYPH|nr:DUF167 domain-containing protein [Lichenifustis flavocetrariae]MCW6510294.1 DUF167 domain-containing protein [Lichenifustis flavocetrariae]